MSTSLTEGTGYGDNAATTGSGIIELIDVGVRFGATEVLRDVYKTVAVGDYVTVTGRSGSGKSTLLNVIAGTVFATTGTARIDGADLGRARERARVQRNIVGYLFQSSHLVGWMNAADVALGMRYQEVPRRERRERTLAALDRVGLGHRLTHRPGELSGGERQRVALARAVARLPKVLLADEPTGNLDVETGAQVIDLLEEVGVDTALVLVTHDPALAARGRRRWRVERNTVTESTAQAPHAR